VSRRKWVQREQADGTYKLEEVDLNYVGRRRSLDLTDALVNDRHYDGCKATDGTPINTRARHREYMRRNGLTTADDYTQEWADAPRKRELEQNKGRREGIERAIHNLEGPP